jgi:predicted HicB family RNase H-like nuclease
VPLYPLVPQALSYLEGQVSDTPKAERLTVYVPPDLRRAVKVAAAQTDTSMTAWVIAALSAALPKSSPLAAA